MQNGYITMKYDSVFIKKALALRTKGYSFAEIAKKLGTAKSTASLWTRSVNLTATARSRLINRSVNGRLKSVAFFKKKSIKELHENKMLARNIIRSIKISKNLSKIVCSLLYWCEGSKSNLVKFTSSDPILMKAFLDHLRRGFEIDERKFRALMHLHQYHDETKQRRFWQQVTNIPTKQFNRTFWKSNSGKNVHPDYPGCLAVTYLSAKVAREIGAIYNVFGDLKIGT